jgi:hypothetical protein
VPEGGIQQYTWDLFRSGVMGSSDGVTLRMTAHPDVRPHPHQVAGNYLYGSFSTTSFPFRVHGTIVRVLHAADPPQMPAPAARAIVYRLDKDQESG